VYKSQVEMFGPAVGPYAAVACVVSYLMTGHRSVYPSQLLAVKKSSSIDIELGKEMDNVHASYLYRNKTIIGMLLNLWKRMAGKWQRPEP